MRESIRETCSCGAVLEFSESYNEAWEGSTSYRQLEFHKAHSGCRNTPQPPSPEAK